MTLAERGAAGREEALRRFGDHATSQQHPEDQQRARRGEAGRAEAERRFGKPQTTGGEDAA